MQISSGIIHGAQKVAVYGPEGIGKSSFAAQFPKPVFIDTEGSTKLMNVARTPAPSSWTMLLEQVKYFKANPTACDTLIIDTGDWAEQLCIAELCAKANKGGIEDFGYGKGYTYLAEEFGRLLNLLTELIDLGINVVIVAHAQMRKFEQPDEMGAYDRWEMKLQKKVYPLVKEWADQVLFCNYKTYVVDADGQGTAKGTNKVQGGKRVMFTTHHPCWDAKNRHGLKDELPLAYAEIAHCIPIRGNVTPLAKDAPPAPAPATPTEPAPVEQPRQNQVDTPPAEPAQNIPKPLADLMAENKVTVHEIQKVVSAKGYYPIDTPIDRYDPSFVSGVLVAAWPQVFGLIKKIREDEIPFQ